MLGNRNVGLWLNTMAHRNENWRSSFVINWLHTEEKWLYIRWKKIRQGFVELMMKPSIAQRPTIAVLIYTRVFCFVLSCFFNKFLSMMRCATIKRRKMMGRKRRRRCLIVWQSIRHDIGGSWWWIETQAPSESDWNNMRRISFFFFFQFYQERPLFYTEIYIYIQRR